MFNAQSSSRGISISTVFVFWRHESLHLTVFMQMYGRTIEEPLSFAYCSACSSIYFETPCVLKMLPYKLVDDGYNNSAPSQPSCQSI